MTYRTAYILVLLSLAGMFGFAFYGHWWISALCIVFGVIVLLAYVREQYAKWELEDRMDR